MQPHADWSKWAKHLRRYKMDGLVSWLLDAGSPLSLLGAQVLYICQPLFGGKLFGLVANVLEDEESTRSFADYLRREELT